MNRYALVCHPFTHVEVTSRKGTIIQLTAVILICSTLNIYLIFSCDPKLAFCGLDVTYNIGMVVYYVGVTTFDIFIWNLIPIIMTLTLTLKVMYTLAKNTEHQSNREPQERRASADKLISGRKHCFYCTEPTV